MRTFKGSEATTTDEYKVVASELAASFIMREDVSALTACLMMVVWGGFWLTTLSNLATGYQYPVFEFITTTIALGFKILQDSQDFSENHWL